MRTRSVRSFAAAATLAAVGLAAASADPFAPPAGYYDPADGLTGAPLAQALHQVISPHIVRSYGNARQALAVLDRSDADPTRLRLFYNGLLVSKQWDSGATWNREHTWPRSLGVGSSGPDNSDLHMLRPCTPSVNGSRGNKPFGDGAGYWDPDALGGEDRGEAARIVMYADVRYDGFDSSTSDLTLVPGWPSGAQMGDLPQLLLWHYAAGPDERERRRNHTLFLPDDGLWFDAEINTFPVWYHQGNRNPFVDRPEFAWAIWGPWPNTSTLSVAPPDADGASSVSIDLGRAIVGAEFGGGSFVIDKAGTDPASYDLSTTGSAVLGAGVSPQGNTIAAAPPPGQTYEPEMIAVGLTPAASAGVVSGTVVVENSDLTSDPSPAGRGRGARDAHDVVELSATLLNPSAPSFDPSAIETTTSVDLGEVAANAPSPGAELLVFNVDAAAGPDAWFDLDAAAVQGADAGSFSASVVGPSSAGPGSSVVVAVAPTFAGVTGEGGPFSATVVLTLSDEDVPGERTGLALEAAVSAWLTPPVLCSGDATFDGRTDVSDFFRLAQTFGSTSPTLRRSDGDVVDDGSVDISDFFAIASDFGCDAGVAP